MPDINDAGALGERRLSVLAERRGAAHDSTDGGYVIVVHEGMFGEENGERRNQMQIGHFVTLDGGEKGRGFKGRKSHDARAMDRKGEDEPGQAVDVVEWQETQDALACR